MNQKIQLKWLIAILVLALSMTAAQAITIETVPVGNLSNIGEWSGVEWRLDRICGVVNYAYNIGKYEVTAGQYCEFLNAVAATDTYGLYNPEMDSHSYGCQITQNGNSGHYTYDFSGGAVEAPGSTAADWKDRPVNFVDWGDAVRFANWLHNGQPTGAQDLNTTEDGAYYLNGATSDAALMAVNREVDWKWAITSEDEWYKAAYHKNDGNTGNYFDYPTSSDTAPNNNLDGGGNNATFYSTSDDDYTIGAPYWRTEIGTHENSGSPYGTFGQCGNVVELNDTAISTEHRGIRGGLFSGPVDGMAHANFRIAQQKPTSSDWGLGFRVVQVPEPGSIALMLCGLISIVYLKRWR